MTTCQACDDLIVWHSRSIHKIDGPKTQDWDDSRRRVLGGTVAVNDAKYLTMGARRAHAPPA